MLFVFPGTVAASSEVTEESEQQSISASEEASCDDHIKPVVEVVLAQDEKPLERLIPTETEVKEAVTIYIK